MNVLAEKYYDEIIKTAADMVKIPSVSGSEKAMAEYTVKKMQNLGYDEVRVDRCGNVIGLIKGSGGGKSTMYNCHLDVVDPGPVENWKYAPYSGEIAEGRLWGRGASDTKATFAIQIYTPYILKKENLLPKGDIYVVGVVHEETTGFGSMNMAADGFLTDFAVVGEATENELGIASRGRIVVLVNAIGKSCHASVPHTGINPFDFFAKFLPALRKYEPKADELFGFSTLTPTKIVSSESGTNLVPSSVTLCIDYRSVPSETDGEILAKISAIANECLSDGMKVEVTRMTCDVTCYNGLTETGMYGEPSYAISPEHILVKTAQKALEEVYKHRVPIKPWAFATDCGHFSNKGVAVIGFSPAELKKCHTVEDSMDLKMFKDGIAGNLAIANSISNIEK